MHAESRLPEDSWAAGGHPIGRADGRARGLAAGSTPPAPLRARRRGGGPAPAFPASRAGLPRRSGPRPAPGAGAPPRPGSRGCRVTHPGPRGPAASPAPPRPAARGRPRLPRTQPKPPAHLLLILILRKFLFGAIYHLLFPLAENNEMKRPPLGPPRGLGRNARLCSLLQRGELGSPLRLGPGPAAAFLLVSWSGSREARGGVGLGEGLALGFLSAEFPCVPVLTTSGVSDVPQKSAPSVNINSLVLIPLEAHEWNKHILSWLCHEA